MKSRNRGNTANQSINQSTELSITNQLNMQSINQSINETVLCTARLMSEHRTIKQVRTSTKTGVFWLLLQYPRENSQTVEQTYSFEPAAAEEGPAPAPLPVNRSAPFFGRPLFFGPDDDDGSSAFPSAASLAAVAADVFRSAMKWAKMSAWPIRNSNRFARSAVALVS